MRRDCPRWEGFPLGESEWGQTRAQPTQSTPTQALQRSQHSVPQIYQAGEEKSPCCLVRCRFLLVRYVRANEYSYTPYPTDKNVSQYQQSNSSLNIYLFIVPTRWRRKPKSNYFKSQTKFSSTNSLSAKSIGNSNDYRQLKSIDNSDD